MGHRGHTASFLQTLCLGGVRQIIPNATVPGVTMSLSDGSPLDLRDYLSILWGPEWIVLAIVATTTTVAANERRPVPSGPSPCPATQGRSGAQRVRGLGSPCYRRRPFRTFRSGFYTHSDRDIRKRTEPSGRLEQHRASKTAAEARRVAVRGLAARQLGSISCARAHGDLVYLGVTPRTPSPT
jgi:hypothetical protein